MVLTRTDYCFLCRKRYGEEFAPRASHLADITRFACVQKQHVFAIGELEARGRITPEKYSFVIKTAADLGGPLGVAFPIHSDAVVTAPRLARSVVWTLSVSATLSACRMAVWDIQGARSLHLRRKCALLHSALYWVVW